MVSQYVKRGLRAATLALLAGTLAFSAVSAQDVENLLIEGQQIEGELSEISPAAIFTFDAAAGDAANLIVNNASSLSLAVVLSDAEGSIIAQSRDDGAGQVLLSAPIDTAGTYYVTVFYAPGAVAADGSFQITLLSDEQVAALTDLGSATEEPAATEETTGQIQPTPLDLAEATQTPVAVVDLEERITTNGMQVQLVWTGAANLDLEVRDPIGNTLYFDNPSLDFGASFSQNVNANCENVVTDSATETASWSAGGLPVGSYEVLVYYQEACEGNIPVDFTINISVDGQTLAPITSVLLPEQVFIGSYRVTTDSQEVSPRSGIRGDATLPASAAVIISAAQPLVLGDVIEGEITSAEPFDSYAFDVTGNTLVSINMNAFSGSLDPYIALLDPNGNIVYANDDAAAGVTDAALNNSLLVVAGRYTLVASRYGLAIGGTEGQYQLALQTPATASATIDPATLGVGTPAPTQIPNAVLPQSVLDLQLPEGNIEVTLVWNTNADLQLLVRDPSGDPVFDDAPTIRSGGLLASSGNVNCTATTTSPVSYVYWPLTVTPRGGSYEIDVWFQNECADASPVQANLYVTVAGQLIATQSIGSSVQFLQGEHYVTSFTINQDGSVVAGEGGITGLNTLDWPNEVQTAGAIAGSQTINGSITPENKFDLYAFDGIAGDIVSISLTAAPGTNLDTKLYLIGPNGTAVANNDDALIGENTNSLINNFTLPEDGQYIIIATHYGERYGISSGTYTLTLNQ